MAKPKPRTPAQATPSLPAKTTGDHGLPTHPAARKHQVLTKKTPSTARSIADAPTIMDRDVFLVCRNDGAIPDEKHSGFGLYFHDCRYLSHYEIRLGGQPLEVLASSFREGYKAVFQLTNAAIHDLTGKAIPQQTLGLRLSRLVRGEQLALFDVYELRNFGLEAVEVELELRFAADFLDVLAVRGLLELAPGKVREPAWRHGALTLAYDGKDGVYRGVDLGFKPAPDAHRAGTVTYRLALEAGEHVELMVSLALTEACGEPTAPRRVHADLEGVEAMLEASARTWVTEHCRVRADAPLFNRIYCQCFRDLHSLRMELDGLEFFAAGVPWFATLFGRDSLMAAMQMLPFDAALAESTLKLLAKYQGRANDGWRDEDPGKILHELRLGELARLDEIPHTPFYGSVDATPLFLIVLAAHARWTGSLDLFKALRSNVEAALTWIETTMNQGYLIYNSPTNGGMVNQGWKDAGNSILNEDGSLARPPIALAEVQGYVYAAWLAIADLLDRSDEAQRAAGLRKEAACLKDRFNRDFWLPARKYYAMALQGSAGEPVATVGSNPGQALWTGIVAEERAAAVAKRLMTPAMFGGWGVRTVSAAEQAFNPIGYHLGTVWPHDNGLIAAGLRRYGHDYEAHRIFRGIFEAASHFDIYRMPEVFAGFPAEPYGEPVRYPVACHPQAWAAGSLPFLLTTMLGLEPDGFGGRLRIVRPRLLDLVEELDLEDLQVGRASVDLRFRRRQGRVEVEVAPRHGKLEVEVDYDG